MFKPELVYVGSYKNVTVLDCYTTQSEEIQKLLKGLQIDYEQLAAFFLNIKS